MRSLLLLSDSEEHMHMELETFLNHISPPSAVFYIPVAFFIKLIPLHKSLPADSLLARSVIPSSLPWREAVSPSWLVLGPDLL